MKHLILVALLFIFSVNQTNAQTDKRAADILKSVSAKYKSYSSIQATFSLARLDQKTKKSDNYNGSISLSGQKYNFSMADQTVICDGKTTWTYLKEANEVQISENKPAEGAITPSNIFTMYEKGFRYKFMGESNKAGVVVQQIELTPEDAKKNYFKILLTVDKNGKYVREAKIFEKNGGIITYSIVKFTPNVSLTSDPFTFNKAKFPDAEIVDLR